MSGTFILLLLGSSAIFMAAASASRAYVSSDNWLWVVLSMCLYVSGNLIMIRLMREGGLGLAISVSAIVQLVLVNVIAFAVFSERITNIQMGGVALGIVAMVLMMWPGKVSG
jgi:small multidrug resistance pump